MTATEHNWPSGFVSPKQVRAYWDREARIGRGVIAVGHDGVCGTRWRHGPFFFEKYTTDEEPAVAPDGPWRYVIWQPLTLTESPRGWRRSRLGIGFRGGGVFELHGGDWEARWAPSARRQLKKWRGLADEGWRIERCDATTFCRALARGQMRPDLKAGFAKVVAEKDAAHPGLLRCYLAVAPGGEPTAGLAVLDVPEVKVSIHLAAFTAKAARGTPAGVGLMAAWFTDSAAEGFAWLDLGNFWRPGEPRDWRGFSRFKAQFITQPLDFPRPFTRFAGSWRGTLSALRHKQSRESSSRP
jgi:hypothetical protein